MPKTSDDISATPGNKLTQSKKNHGISETSLGTRARAEGYERYVRVDSNGDELSTTAPPPKRVRFIEAIGRNPKEEYSEPYNQAYHQPVPQHPAPQLPALITAQCPATHMQLPKTQHTALRTQQTRPLPHQKASSSGQETPSVPMPDAQEQSRQLQRILSCPADAYFDILSLANGTDMFALVEASWLSLSFMLHPRVCPLPDAVTALSRINDSYSWIQKHPGLAQPYVSPPPMPTVAQDTTSARRAFIATSFLRVDTVKEPQQIRDSSSTQPQPSPPPRTFGPRPSSHIYVKNGKPTIRPAVGWQFREHGGETRVWYKGRWRPLLQHYPTFQGLRVDEGGWIMPVMDRDFSENQRRKVRGQAKYEFNSHP